jgi:hypothetical protein
MTCEHLLKLEQALIKAGMEETFRGQPWSNNCREWVYFNCMLPLAEIRTYFALADCVEDHQHLGTHSGSESGLVCQVHHDAIMGHHPEGGFSGRRFEPRCTDAVTNHCHQ